MSVKTEKVKEILSEFFGPFSAKQVDEWVKQGASDDEVIAKARTKVSGFLGERKAEVLDAI